MIFSYLAFERVHLTRYLSGDANDTASGAETSVTSLEGVWVSSLAEIISAGVDNDGALRELAIVLFYCPSASTAWWKLLKREDGRWSEEAQLERTYADDAIRADELDQLVGGGAGGVSLGISAEVAEVTNVALLVGGGTVVLATGVDWGRKLAWWSLGLAVPGSSGLSFLFPSSFCFISASIFRSPLLSLPLSRHTSLVRFFLSSDHCPS